MTSVKWLSGLIAILLVGGLGYKAMFPSYSYRYRLQLAVEVDGKVHTGSSVIEVTWECGPKLAGFAQCAPSVGGQATVIDLGSHGVVVATLYTGENITPVPE
ncbi:hypothetical protein RCI25_29185, partial [Pseudomonas aeruginosa]